MAKAHDGGAQSEVLINDIYDFRSCRTRRQWRELWELLGVERESSAAGSLERRLAAAKSVVVESEYLDKDYRNVYSAHYSKRFAKIKGRAHRAHFFSVRVRQEHFVQSRNGGQLRRLLGGLYKRRSGSAWPSWNPTTPGYIGSVVIRPTEYSKIGRTLLDPWQCPAKSEGLCEGILAEFPVHLMGHELTVRAFPAQSQDAEVHSCAETSIWCVLRYMSQRYHMYPERYPYEIATAPSNSGGRRVLPSQGLMMESIGNVLLREGLSPELYDLKMPPVFPEHPGPKDEPESIAEGRWWAGCESIGRQDDLLRLLHVYIDSKLPTIIGLPEHAVVGVGVEYADAASPLIERKGRTIPATDFVKAFIVNDDNKAPYDRLPREREKGSGHLASDIDSLSVPLPPGVFLSAESACAAMESLLNRYFKALGPGEGPQFVNRLLLTSSRNYKRHLHLRARNSPFADFLLRQRLPQFLWLGQYHRLTDWPTGHVVIEVALDPTAAQFDPAPHLWIRYGLGALVNWGRLYGQDEVRTDHYDLSGEDPREWGRFGENLERFWGRIRS